MNNEKKSPKMVIPAPRLRGGQAPAGIYPHNGILLLKKPQGITSAVASRKVKKKFKLKKVGHGGTLDPIAEGLLPIFVNEATKLVHYMLNVDKKYEGKFLLGAETDTLDITGAVVATDKRVSSVTDEKIREKMRGFLGPIEQYPPMYSAVKKNGKPLYFYARHAKRVDRTPRTVEIFDFQMVERVANVISFKVHCSKGTYVRTLCSDLAKQLGTYACLTELKRTACGNLSVEDAIELSQLTHENCVKSPHWKSLTDLLKIFPSVVLKPALAKRVQCGYSPLFSEISKNEQYQGEPWLSFLDVHGKPLALATADREQQAFLLNRVFNI